MTNEIIKNETGEIEIVEEKKPTIDYNAKIGEDVVGLQIKCKRVKNEKNDFISVKGLLYLPVYDDGELIGKRNRWIDVHFTKDAFKGVPNQCEIHTPDDLTTGTLYIKKKGIQVPSKYAILEDEDGNDVYPSIWVRGEIVGFIPYTPDDDMFKYHEPIQEGKYSEVTQDDEITTPYVEGSK